MPGPTTPPNKPTRAEYIAGHRELLKVQERVNSTYEAALAAGDLATAQDCVAELNLKLEEFKGLRAQLPPQDLFIMKYNVQVHGEHEVSLVLPKGVSRIEILEGARRVAIRVYGRDAVWPKQFTQWSQEEAFKASTTKSGKLWIDGNVKGSTNKTRQEQEGFIHPREMPCLEDLAVVHAAFFVATGNNLFQGNWVRVRGGTLVFDDVGLGVCGWLDDGRYDRAAVAVALHARN